MIKSRQNINIESLVFHMNGEDQLRRHWCWLKSALSHERKPNENIAIIVMIYQSLTSIKLYFHIIIRGHQGAIKACFIMNDTIYYISKCLNVITVAMMSKSYL